MNFVQLDNLCKIHKKRRIFLSTALLEFCVNIMYNLLDRMLTRTVKWGVLRKQCSLSLLPHMGVEEKRREKF